MGMRYEKLFVKLKEQGVTSYQIRKKKIIGERTLTALRNNQSVTTDAIGRLCQELQCQPGDIMEYEFDTAEIQE